VPFQNKIIPQSEMRLPWALGEEAAAAAACSETGEGGSDRAGMVPSARTAGGKMGWGATTAQSASI